MTVFVDDEPLLRRFRAGERAALETVYWHYVDAVEAVLRRCLGASNRSAGALVRGSEVADLVQDVFVKAFSERARWAYDGKREYRPFLMSLARNTFIDYLRGAPREVRLDAATIDALVDSAAETEGVPWGEPNIMALVENYVAELGDEERAVYVQRYVRCCSQESAARELGTTRQHVRTLENRLRMGLSRALARFNLREGIKPPAHPPPSDTSPVSPLRRESLP